MEKKVREGVLFPGMFSRHPARKMERTIGGALLLFNLGVWGGFLFFGGEERAVLEMGVLAFLVGVRHGFDADHIAVIDNLTRRLSPSSAPSRAVGFLFATGHASVVILSNLVLIAFFQHSQVDLRPLVSIGSWMGTLFSAGFLTFIGLVNGGIIFGIVRRVRERRMARPVLSRWFPHTPSSPALPGWFPHSSRGIFLIGVLFGLSLDTSAEIALLLLALTLQISGPNHLLLLGLLPGLFATGMVSVDTMDGILMARAYGWAMKDFRRTFFYNLTLTGLSVFVALGLGALEWIHLWRGTFLLEGPSWAGTGLAIFVGFMSLWALMALLRRWRGLWWRRMEG